MKKKYQNGLGGGDGKDSMAPRPEARAISYIEQDYADKGLKYSKDVMKNLYQKYGLDKTYGDFIGSYDQTKAVITEYATEQKNNESINNDQPPKYSKGLNGFGENLGKIGGSQNILGKISGGTSVLRDITGLYAATNQDPKAAKLSQIFNNTAATTGIIGNEIDERRNRDFQNYQEQPPITKPYLQGVSNMDVESSPSFMERGKALAKIGMYMKPKNDMKGREKFSYMRKVR